MIRSFRAKSSGWRNESSRHALAARGIKTRKNYLVDYDRMASRLKGVFHDGSPDVHGTDMKPMVVQSVQSKVMEELDEDTKSGRMSFEDAQSFMNNEFTRETKQFMSATRPDRKSYEDEVFRLLKRHREMHSNTRGIL